jgi:cytochrome bd-type quinol oxidase subunit 2
MNCRVLLMNRTYCQACADALFAGRVATQAPKGRSGLLIAGGILAIIGGALAVISAIGIGAQYLLVESDSDLSLSSGDVARVLAIVVSALVFGLLQMIAGIFALQRKRFRFALVGAILGMLTLPSFVFGLLATIFIALSKSDFKAKTPTVAAANQ